MSENTLGELYQEEVYELPHPPVIVFLPVPWEQLSGEDVGLLSKILAAIKLSLAAVKVVIRPYVDLNGPDAGTGDLFLVFGCKTDPPLELYKKSTIRNNVNVITSDQLHELDDTRKRSLWLALKQVIS